MASTIAALFRSCTTEQGDRVITYYRDASRQWVGITGKESYEKVRQTGLGLAHLGIMKGDRVAIVSETRVEWLDADAAAFCLGAITVGIYPTLPASEVAYILNHSESRAVFVENERLLRNLLPLLPSLPTIEIVILMTGAIPQEIRNVQNAQNAQVLTFEELREKGAAFLKEHPGYFESQIDAITPDDPLTYIYTSGTTGVPKGVVLTHGAFVFVGKQACEVEKLSSDDVSVVFLPLAHSLQRMAVYAGFFSRGRGYFVRIESLLEDLKEVRPTVMASVPRIFEKAHARILERVEKGSRIKKALFSKALAVGTARSAYLQRREKVPWQLEIRWRFFDRLVFQKIRAAFGGRVKAFYSGGAPIEKKILEFFHALGVLILEGYGLTETSAPATLNTPESFRFGTVGRALPGVELRIDEDGEILIKSPANLREYYKDPVATKAAITEDGWFRSGDIGELDADGFLKITDRKKDLIKTAGGKYVAPQKIENLLKTHPLISQVVVHGDRRPYCVALITLDAEPALSWATERGIRAKTIADLANHAEVEAEIAKAIESLNGKIAKFESIKRWAILPNDFSVETGELTPTLKLKRRIISERHAALIESLYAMPAAKAV